jgi:hypothetical protein
MIAWFVDFLFLFVLFCFVLFFLFYFFVFVSLEHAGACGQHGDVCADWQTARPDSLTLVSSRPDGAPAKSSAWFPYADSLIA